MFASLEIIDDATVQSGAIEQGVSSSVKSRLILVVETLQNHILVIALRKSQLIAWTDVKHIPMSVNTWPQ